MDKNAEARQKKVKSSYNLARDSRGRHIGDFQISSLGMSTRLSCGVKFQEQLDPLTQVPFSIQQLTVTKRTKSCVITHNVKTDVRK